MSTENFVKIILLVLSVSNPVPKQVSLLADSTYVSLLIMFEKT